MSDEALLETADEVIPTVKRVLVPTDFSLASQRAIVHGIRVARQTGAELLVVHVSDSLPVPPGCTGHEYLVRQDHARQAMKDRLKALVDQLAGGSFEGSLLSIAVEGVPSHEIIRAAQDNDVDILFISTHGHTGFKRFFLGTTADKVVRFAPCSVLLVRKKMSPLPMPEDS